MMKEMSPEEKAFPEELIAEMVDYATGREHAARDADKETVMAAYERGYWDGVKASWRERLRSAMRCLGVLRGRSR